MAIMDIADQYYTYDGRLASFQSAQPLSKRRTSNVSSKAPKSTKWPHSSLPPEQMAKAGFFHYPTQENPDNTVCFLCRKSMDGWEEDDDPLVEHLKHSPNCGWAIVASIDARDPMLSQEYPLSTRMIEARKATFGDRWPHENKKGWKCKVKQLVDAGWIYTPTPEYDDMATCAYCDLALDGWEPSDKPLDEHHKRSESCAFFSLISEHQDTSNAPKMHTKSRKLGASKTTRLSAQSAYTIASEEPSTADFLAEDGDSVLTTATNSTTVSKSGRKMAKGKKPAKGRKPKAKKDPSAEVSVDMEPEDADFEVKIEQPKATRGKKRSSEETYESPALIDMQQPPAKRRGARNTRGSVAAADNSFALSNSEKDVDAIMTSTDGIMLDKPGLSRKKGRPSNAKTQRNVSSASTASKASLRMTKPDDEEIDNALQADLERPLTDEEDHQYTDEIPNSRRESQLKNSTLVASTAPVRKTTRGSRVHKDYNMFAAGEVSIDESNIEAELKAIELEEAMPLPKAKGATRKQPRKPSAKQQAAAQRIAEAASVEVSVAEDTFSSSNQVEIGKVLPSFPKPRKGRNTGSMATSRKLPSRATRASVVPVDKTNIAVALSAGDAYDSADDSDASAASNSTVVRAGAKRRGSSVKKGKTGNRAVSRNIKEIIQQSSDKTTSQQEAEDLPQKKRGGRPKKVVDTRDTVDMGNPEQTESSVLQETLKQQLATKPSKGKARKAKGKDKVLPDLSADEEAGPSKQSNKIAPESPKRAPKELTPSVSPQSSDAENQPPSSKPSTMKPVGASSQVSRIPLSASTPTTSPSKRNIIAGLQSTQPWTAVDLDEILLQSSPGARAEKENSSSGLLAEAIGKIKKGDLTSPEKKMTVEEWIMYNASLAEEKLKGECERMVGIFEREGGRAMRVLEGVVCTE